ncbi:MAG: hypothetical protein ACJ757_11510 [Gaiellaceae bacterium]
MGWWLTDDWEGGFGWSQDEFMRRTSHALVVEGRVWLTDPVDTPELEERVRASGEPAGVLQLLDRHERGCAAWAARLGVPHLRAWETLGAAPFEALRVRKRRWWHEVALWEPTARTLVCADALGTVAYFCAPGERIGLHPLVRPFPPRALARVAPERILCGHGEGVLEDAANALHEALQTGRRRLPAAWLSAISAGVRRTGREAPIGRETRR